MLLIARNKICLLGLLLFLFIGCGTNHVTESEKSDFIFNTFISVRIYDPVDPPSSLFDSVFSEMKIIEKHTNFYDASSDLNALNRQIGTHRDSISVPSALDFVVKKSLFLGELTQGGLDISIGAVSKLWPFGHDSAVPPTREYVQKKLRYVDYKQLIINNQIMHFLKNDGPVLDLSSVNKGYGVDKAVEVLQRNNIKTAIVDAGGNLGILWDRTDSMKVYIRHPENPGRMIGFIYISTPISVATSGNYMNTFEYRGQKYHHVLDPRTGFPSDSAASVTVFAQTALEADGLGTGLFVKGVRFTGKFLRAHPQYDVCFIQKAKRIYLSPYLRHRFVLLDSTYTLHPFYE